MNILHLKAFYTVAKEGSFTGAARRLFVSQPSLSKQVQALEAELGVLLLERHGRGVRPTEAGAALLQYAERVFLLLREAEDSMCAYRGLEKGQLAIGASPTLGIYTLPAAIYHFHRRHPGLYIRVFVGTTPQVVDMILANELNIGLVEGELKHPDSLSVEILREEELAVIVSPRHPWRKRDEITPEELAQADFINREIGSRTRELYETTLARLGVELNSMVELSSSEAIKNCVKTGWGVAIVSRSLVEEDIRAGRLYALRIKGVPLKRSVKLIRRVGRKMCPAGKAFVKYLRASMPPPPTE